MVETAYPLTGYKHIQCLIARHPIATFVTLAFSISWISWLFQYLFDFGLVNGFGIIGRIGPALAALIVSGILRDDIRAPIQDRYKPDKRNREYKS